MKFTKLLLVAFFILISSGSIAEPGTSCEIPYSRSIRIGLFQPTESALPIELTQTTQIGSAVSTTAGVLTAIDVTLLSQGARAYSTLQIVSCNDASLPDSGPLSWMDSPTQLSVGDDALQYNTGAVVGNWLLLGGVTTAWTIVATRLGTTQAHFPGGLTLPVLFLMTPTAASATTLIRDGTVGQQVLGTCSIVAHSIGVTTVAVFLHPAFFGANWVSEHDQLKWVDAQEPGYVKHYGLLFVDYRGTRHLFIIVELLMSTATGILKSYQAAQSACRDIVTAAAGISMTYFISLAALRPHQELKDRAFFTAIAGFETLALTIQAASMWLASEETQKITRTVSESMVMVAEWALTFRMIYDVGQRIRSVYHYFHSGSPKPQPLSLSSLVANDQELQLLEPLTTPTSITENIPDEILSVKSTISNLEIGSDRSGTPSGDFGHTQNPLNELN